MTSSIQSDDDGVIRSNNTPRKHSKRQQHTNNNSSTTTTRIIILGGRSQHPLPSTEGSGMKIDRSHFPTLLVNDDQQQPQPIFSSVSQWNTFCDTINSSLQIYNVVITNHDKTMLSRIVIFPIVGFTLIAIIVIIFGRPYIGLGIFVATVVTSLTVWLYDRNRVDRAYDRAITNLKSVIFYNVKKGRDQLLLSQHLYFH